MIYDIVFICIVLLFTIIGVKRGAAKTLLSLLSVVVAVVGAVVLSRFLAQLVFDGFIRQSLTNSVNSLLTESLVGDALISASAVVSAIPSYALSAMSYFGLDTSSFTSFCQQSVEEHGVAAAGTIVDAIEPSVTGAISTILSFILFAVLLFVLLKLSKLLERAFKLPLVNGVNSFLGGVLGFLSGVLTVYICAVLLKLLLPLFSGDWVKTAEEFIGTSYVFSFIYSGTLSTWIQLFIYNVDKLM